VTGRERLTNIINRKPVDRLCWSTLICQKTRLNMPEQVRAMPSFDFYRHIGSDHFTYGSPCASPLDPVYQKPVRRIAPGITEKWEPDADNGGRHTIESPFGTLTMAVRNSHPIEYRIKTVGDLRTFNKICQATHYEPVEDDTLDSWNRLDAALGDLGIYCEFNGTSPLQNLIQFDMGLETFYGLLQDHEREMEELFDILHEKQKQMYEIYCRLSPAGVIMPVENTSTMLISPALYRKYTVPHLRDYAEIIHRHGKKMVLHMCGHLKGLLPYFRETGLDGINALTPPPIGDTPYELALDVLGDDFVLLGVSFNGAVFQSPFSTVSDIHRELDRVYTPRVRKANLVLSLFADGIPTDLWRFMAVRDWMEKNGKL